MGADTGGRGGRRGQEGEARRGERLLIDRPRPPRQPSGVLGSPRVPPSRAAQGAPAYTVPYDHTASRKCDVAALRSRRLVHSILTRVALFTAPHLLVFSALRSIYKFFSRNMVFDSSARYLQWR